MRAARVFWGAVGVALAVCTEVGVSGAGRLDGKSLEAIQEERATTMKAINRGMRRIKVYASKGDLAEVAKAAAEVAELVPKIPALSPEGSNVGKTRIKPEVWKNFGHYKELAARSAEAARALVRVAGNGDRRAVMRSFADLAKSCTACHKPYRSKKKRPK